MSIVCRIVGHKWYKTADGKDGCICVRCGEKNSFGKHELYKEPGNCQYVCSRCKDRLWIEHDWDGCTCTWCGKVCNADHKWERVDGTCELRCSRCGKVSETLREHAWDGCTCTRCGAVRFTGHDFVPSPETGKLFCAKCGIAIDENRLKAALDALDKSTKGRDNKSYMTMLELIDEMQDPECVFPLAYRGVYSAMERLGELGADEKLASIARDENRGYNARNEARRYINDKTLRDSIEINMSEEEQRWYDYDIKSGM